MDNQPTITFKKLCNGGINYFPSHATGIFFLAGFTDLLHIAQVTANNKRMRKFNISTYRNGQECKLFVTAAPKNNSLRCYEGKTISISDAQLPIGYYISYGNGSFKAKKISTPEGLWSFIRYSGDNYFVLSHNDGFSLVTSNSDTPLLEWNEPNSLSSYFNFCDHDFILCHAFQDRYKIVKYAKVNDAYREIGNVSVPFEAANAIKLGDNFILVMRNGELVIYDSVSMEIVQFTFSPVPGNMVFVAARITKRGLVEIFFSVEHLTLCNIYKASLSRAELEARFESQKINKRIDDLSKQNANLVEENVNNKKKINDLETTVAFLQVNSEQEKARLEAIEKKYNNVLLLLGKK